MDLILIRDSIDVYFYHLKKIHYFSVLQQLTMVMLPIP